MESWSKSLGQYVISWYKNWDGIQHTSILYGIVHNILAPRIYWYMIYWPRVYWYITYQLRIYHCIIS